MNMTFLMVCGILVWLAYDEIAKIAQSIFISRQKLLVTVMVDMDKHHVHLKHSIIWDFEQLYALLMSLTLECGYTRTYCKMSSSEICMFGHLNQGSLFHVIRFF